MTYEEPDEEEIVLDDDDDVEEESGPVNDIGIEVYAMMGDIQAISKPRKGLFRKIGEWNRRRKEQRLQVEEEPPANDEAADLLSALAQGNETDLLMMDNQTSSLGQGFALSPVTSGVASLVESLRVKSAPYAATAQIPLALVILMLALRAFWYYRQYQTKDQKTFGGDSSATTTDARKLLGEYPKSNGSNGAGLKHDPTAFSKGNGTNGHTVVMTAQTASTTIQHPEEDKIQSTLEREMRARQALADENRALQLALDTHKSTVDKFSTELQARNERLSVFENEQDTVRRDLSAQIEVLKQELQERQKQEQGNLKSKESLCNDLITKIKALNQDLENHEKLWQGVAQKAQQKETESAKKVMSLQQSLREDEEHRVAALRAKEEARAELNAQVSSLEKQQNQQASQQVSLEQQMGTSVFSATEARLQKQLEEEQKLATTLNTKMQVFSAELASREERVSTLDAKMNEVERLSVVELKQLQQELQKQVVQREKLQQVAVEMTRVLQEKRDQCVRLQSQWETSKAELKALDERVATLTASVAKREAMANSRIQAVEKKLEEERRQEQICKQATEATNDELFKKQEEFVQLTTRMDLFLKELQFRDEQVASLENKLMAKEERTTSEIKALSEQLSIQRERQDSWNKTTEDLQQMLKDKKAQVVGLETRVELFERELKNRQDTVAALEARIEENEEEEAAKMEPYRRELRRLQNERDDWREKTEEIGRVLEEKIDQTEGLSTRLRLFRVELKAKDERLTVLKSTYRDKKQAAYVEMAPVKEKLEEQREQRDFWAAKIEDIDRVLKEKRAQCVGLKTRVLLFGRELETKEKLTAALESKLADKEEVGGAAIASLRKQFDEQVKGRDEWKESTEKVKQLLVDKRKESAGLTSELKVLVSDLQGYQQRRAALEDRMKQQRNIFSGRKVALEKQLSTCKAHCDEWKNQTAGLSRECHNAEQSIVGLKTRDMLFKKELQQRREALETLEEQLEEMEEKSASKMARFRQEMAASKVEHEDGVEMTLKLNKELKDTKRECIGLTTRSKLFKDELQKRENLVVEQEQKVADAKEQAADVLGRMRGALAGMEGERDEWTQKAADVDRLVAENQEQTVGLSTRLDLFMAQVMEYEETVSRQETKLRSRQSLSSMASTKSDLDAAKTKRDDWTAKAIDIQNNLKQRKSEITGLKTRQKLFHSERESRKQNVSIISQRLVEKERFFKAKIAPLEDGLKNLIGQREEWVSKADGIDEMLARKQEECLPISEKRQAVIDQLTQCMQRIKNLESLLKDEEEFIAYKVVRLRRSVEEHRNELNEWVEKTKEVQGLLRGKEGAVVGLNNRLVAFEGELKARERAVAIVESRIAENDRLLAEETSSIKSQIAAAHNLRDTIIETTLSKNQELKKMEDTCSAMEVRRMLFEDEMRMRKERVTSLQSKLQEKEEDFSFQIKALKSEYSLKARDLAKWRESTKEVGRLSNETERECVGLATRLQLFLVEKEKYDSQVAELEVKFKAKANDTVERMTPIHNRLRQEQRDRDSWDQKTTELNGLLQATRREIVGLNTRSKLFNKELKQKERGVAKLTARIKENDDDFAERMTPLMLELNAQKQGCGAWERSTENVQRMLEATMSECASIPTRLDLFRREQKLRDDAVAQLEASISNTDDLVAVQLGFLLNELQLQQKQRGKWKKVTLEMHRLLKETREQVAVLTERLDSNQVALQNHDETITSYETALRDGRDMAYQQLATMKKEVNFQRQNRDKLRKSTEELSRLLEDAKVTCNDLTGKLQSTRAQVQGCTTAIEQLGTRINEKKALDASQIESIKQQLKVHLDQRTEWQENTDQMRQRLKEKQQMCADLQTKITLLKRLQQGDVRSSLSLDESDNTSNPYLGAPNGISAHLDRINDITTGATKKKLSAEAQLTSKMESLEAELKMQQEEEKKLSDSTQQLERELGDKASQVTALTGQLRSSGFDVDAMLKEKEKQQSSLNSRLASLTGELLNL